jgi:hypothetical protein
MTATGVPSVFDPDIPGWGLPAPRMAVDHMASPPAGCNRLLVICHEELDTLAAPHVFPFVAASLEASATRYSSKIG